MHKGNLLHITLLIIVAFAFFVSGCSSDPDDLQPEYKRHIKLEGQKNFRDLGGYEIIDGKTVQSLSLTFMDTSNKNITKGDDLI